MVETKIVGGVIWSIIMRWSMKAIGLVNMVILARLLSPEDFGILAMSAVFIALIEEMSTINVSLLLIRTQESSKDHNNSAWTVSILQGLIIALLMVLLAPVAAAYFKEDRIIDVIYVLAFLKIVFSFRNVGLIIARKELQFAFDFRFMIYARLIRFTCVIMLALYLKSYWAMIFGSLGAEIIAVVLSYIMHPYRPGICFRYLREYLKFAIAMIPMAIAKLLNNKFDVIVVGGNSGTSLMGIYNVSNELSSIFTKELVTPASRGLFPNLSRLTEDRKIFIGVYKTLIYTATAICIPIGAGIWMVSDNLVYVLLGPKWIESIIYLKWLGVYGALESITFIVSEHPLIALGLERKVNLLMWFRLAIRMFCVVAGYMLFDIIGIAIGMAVSALFSFLSVSYFALKELNISFKEIIKSLMRPTISTTIMALSIYIISPALVDMPKIIMLFIQSVSGMAIYVSVLFLMWRLFGMPDGIEKMLIDIIKKKFFSAS